MKITSLHEYKSWRLFWVEDWGIDSQASLADIIMRLKSVKFTDLSGDVETASNISTILIAESNKIY